MFTKKSSSELKSLAKGILIGHYAVPMGGFVITGLTSLLVTTVLNFIFSPENHGSILLYLIAFPIVMLLIGVLSAGNQVIAIKLSRGMSVSIGDLFYGFSHQPDRLILLSLLLELISLGCMLPALALLIAAITSGSFLLSVLSILAALGGIIAAFILLLSYSQVIYIYIDNPDKRVLEIMRESKAMMAGNKGRCFYLQFSFIGLVLLSVLTCYIGMLWLAPYMETTAALFYRNLKGEV